MKTNRNFLKPVSVFLLCFVCVVSNSQEEGWQWQNPYLQGNDLNSIVMNGSIGWAVGALGTVMKTSNSGHDWELVDLGTSENFNCIYMDGISGNGWIVGYEGSVYYTGDGGDTWMKQRSGTSEILYSVTGIEGDCPWICGNDIILRSYDHGETWERINTFFHSHFFSIDLKDCSEAWISGQQGMVISTSDGGETWQSHPTATSNNLFSIDIVANGDYRACGYTGTIICSSDGGTTWMKEHEQTYLYLYNVDTKGIGGPAYAVGGEGTILETLDGGTTWTQRASGTYTYLNDVCFQALMHAVYVTGWYGIILKKEDEAGAEFEIMNERPLHVMQGIDFISAVEGWAVGAEEISDGVVEGVVLHTVDGGENWEVQATFPDGLTAVDFIDENHGWAVGHHGLIKRTSNGGQSWATQNSPMTGLLTSVFFIDESEGWIVSRDNWGEICHTTNGGNTWTLQAESSLNPLSDVFFINPDTGWVVGMDSTIMRTYNGGQNWIKCNLDVSNNPYLRSVQFIDEMTGWTCGTSGFILKSTDGGVSWHEIPTDFYDLLQSLYFTDPRNGWAVGGDGMIVRTIDGGNTWFRQYSGVERGYLTSVCFTDSLNGWFSGEGGTIKRTRNGGFWNEPGVFHKNALNLPILDNTETTDAITVKVMQSRESGYELVGLELMLDSIMHTRVSDLEISLTHNNVTAAFVSHVASPGANFLWMRLKDDATKLIADGASPYSGDYRPHNALNIFNGLDPDGEWTLTIHDNQTGHNGTLRAWGLKPLFERPLGIDEPEPVERAGKITLAQNMPNPFTGKTRINWMSEKAGFTTLKIYNAEGRELAVLVNRNLSKGDHAVEWDGSHYSPGIYYYCLQVDDAMVTKKCIIVR